MAEGPGFEPRLTESEFAVLPLNYPPPDGRRSSHAGKTWPRKTEARLFGEPDDQAAAVTERRVIVPPVGHAMPLPGNVTASLRMLFERHD